MERLTISNGKLETPSLPLIDFSAWTSADSSARRLEVAHDLAEACRRTGFVYLSNHGISPSLVQEAFSWSRRFFDLPLEQKLEAQRDQTTAIFRGYNRPGLQRVPLTLRVRGGDPGVQGFSPDFNVSITLLFHLKDRVYSKILTARPGNVRRRK